MTILLAVLLGFCVDLILGDPRWMPHPVVYMGKAITRLERLLRRLLPDTPRALFWGGVVLAAVLPHPGFQCGCHLAGGPNPSYAGLCSAGAVVLAGAGGKGPAGGDHACV